MQKTAYEMRISDWSSDVCSSDLADWRPRKVLLYCLGPRGGVTRLLRATGRGQWTDDGGEILSELDGCHAARKSVVWGTSVSVRVDLGGRRIIKNKTQEQLQHAEQNNA